MLRNIIGLIIVLAIGGGLVALGIHSYFDLSDWEETGGRRRMHWAYALLYREFGPWGPAVAFIGAGWALICVTLYKFFNRADREAASHG